MRVFNETQKFDQWFMKLIYLSTGGFLLYTLYILFVKKEALGNIGVEDSSGQIFMIGTLIFVLILFYSFKLRTEIDEIGVHYQFRPFHFSRHTIRWEEMEKCYVRTYSPISEYGGWGYRQSFGKKKAYNVKGNKGIQIELENGKNILIGTQQVKDAQQVIDRNFKKDERV